MGKKVEKIKKICQYCGQEYEVYKSEENRSKFCSDKCFRASKKTAAIYKCDCCGKEFEVKQYKIKEKEHGKRQYILCSKSCYNKIFKPEYEKIKQEFKKRDLTLISEEYIDCKSELSFICNKHIEAGLQSVSYDRFKNRNQDCKVCGSLKRNVKRRITVDMVMPIIDKLGLIFVDLILIDGETNIQFMCNNHLGKGIQTITWTHLKESKYGCRYCAGKGRTTEDFINIMRDIHPTIEVLGEYIHTEVPIECRCKIDGHVWSPIPRSLINKQGCPVCGIESTRFKRTKKHDDFVKDLYEVNPNIEVIGEYINSKTFIQCRCKIDDGIWESYPSNLLNETAGCPYCNGTKGERKIIEFLDNNDIKYKYQKKYKDLLGVGNRKLSYDFYLPTYNILIEYQGQYHDGTARNQTEKDFIKQQEHDRRKRKYAKLHNIVLFEIWYWNFNNIEDILKNKLGIILEKSA